VGPTPKSLILDLLSTLRPPAVMPVRAIVAAGELFALDGNAMRVALARLVAKRLVESDERGAYRLGVAAASISAHVKSWRTADERLRVWDASWIAVSTASVPRSDRARHRAGERALRFLGFRTLERGLAVRPNNLVDGTDGSRARLHGLGLDPAALVFTLRDLSESDDARARKLWEVDELQAGYRVMLERLERSGARLARLSDERAMIESFHTGGEAIRLIVLDPLLPEVISPVRARKELVKAMRLYDELGRARWAPFLKSHGAPHRSAPHDGRAIEPASPASVLAAGESM